MIHVRAHWRMILGVLALVLIGVRETVSLMHLTQWRQLGELGAASAILGSVGLTIKSWLTSSRRGHGDQGTE